jgi:hypothetical protein
MSTMFLSSPVKHAKRFGPAAQITTLHCTVRKDAATSLGHAPIMPQDGQKRNSG